MRQPTIFLPHGGGPCFFMDWSPPDEWDDMAAWLRSIPSLLPEPPKALLVVSAHWEERVVTVQSGAQPPLLFDYYGFPPHTYELNWPAPGAPGVAARVKELLDEAGISSRADGERGFDHGVFVPLKLAWPDADVPTLQLSLDASLDPQRHLALGRALAPLRDEGVLIVGSGMSFHNMRMRGPAAQEPSRVFDRWLAEVVEDEPARRDQALAAWARAPMGRVSHPREEHLLPLMVAAGAAPDERGDRAFVDDVMGWRVSGVVFGG
jgi:aromatic ring-opening dioxygenase catalytic subunit (LigB family)